MSAPAGRRDGVGAAAGGPAAATARWAAELAGWAIPPEILAAAPEPPWGFPVELFRADATPADSPSRQAALAALPAGGSVLDVGCGGGAAALALVPPAGALVGVDSGPGMLAAFAAAAAERGVTYREVAGSWPEVADRAGVADVVVCHHVLYNVARLAPFVAALTRAARRRVVVELTAVHPLLATAPLWRAFHGIERPAGPDAQLAVAALRELGLDPRVTRWSRPARGQPWPAVVAMNRRRLCLPVSAEPEVERLLRAGDPDAERATVTVWWPGAASGPAQPAAGAAAEWA